MNNEDINPLVEASALTHVLKDAGLLMPDLPRSYRDGRWKTSMTDVHRLKNSRQDHEVLIMHEGGRLVCSATESRDPAPPTSPWAGGAASRLQTNQLG